MKLARRVVNERFRQLIFVQDVIESLESDEGLAAGVRKTAIEIAEVHGNNAYQLNKQSWDTVISSPAETADYGLALRKAEICCDIVPDSGSYRGTLGIAQYRMVQVESALSSLEKAHDSAVPTVDRYVIEVAFIAMAQHQLGRQIEARDSLGQLQQLFQTDEWSVRSDLRRFLDEAETVIGKSDVGQNTTGA